ncbi:MAG: hypothetical protein EVA65_15860 [Oceanococcus sp.]|nr:MAG: hypothetical protein EVA65_15860 [Oceanococcus sp.]
MATTIEGPFNTYLHRLVIDGYEVPMIRLQPRDDGKWALSLDERFGIDATEEELDRWGWFVANAMAIAAGWSCHGENSTTPNPYKVGMVDAGHAKPKLSLVKKDDDEGI